MHHNASKTLIQGQLPMRKYLDSIYRINIRNGTLMPITVLKGEVFKRFTHLCLGPKLSQRAEEDNNTVFENMHSFEIHIYDFINTIVFMFYNMAPI